MSRPRRWVDDPNADEAVREVLRGAPGARPLDQMTRRRLGAKVLRVSAVPAVAAGWLFVKSAAAALGVVLGAGVIAESTGLVEWSRPAVAPSAAPSVGRVVSALAKPRAVPAPSALPAPSAALEVEALPLNPTPSLPLSPAPSGAGTLSAEVALLERARRELRVAPSAALSIASEHTARFPHGQLAAERSLIQIEALHRLGRDAEARRIADPLRRGPSAGLYAERVAALLGEKSSP